MTPNEYQREALKIESMLRNEDGSCAFSLVYRLSHGLIGLNGEAGEAIDILKKHLFRGHDLDREHLAKELGNVA